MFREQRLTAGKTYTQPLQVSWHEFLKWRGWDECVVEELADDYVYLEWRIYGLKVAYGIGL